MNDLFGERGSVSVSQHVEKFFARNLGKSHPCPDRQAGPVHEGNSRTMNMHADENSDGVIVPEKRLNKEGLPSAEAVEGSEQPTRLRVRNVSTILRQSHF